MSAPNRIPTFGMQQRSERADFYIREKTETDAQTAAHRHEYFQIQFNLGGDTRQVIGNVERPFPRHALAFILPHRVHLIPPPADGHFLLLNFDQNFLLPHLSCSPLDLEDVSVQQAPELTPFRFQQHLDFVPEGAALEDIQQLFEKMRRLDSQRDFGAREYLKGCLLQLIGIICQTYAEPLKAPPKATPPRPAVAMPWHA